MLVSINVKKIQHICGKIHIPNVDGNCNLFWLCAIVCDIKRQPIGRIWIKSLCYSELKPVRYKNNILCCQKLLKNVYFFVF